MLGDERVLVSRVEPMARGHQERLAPLVYEVMAEAAIRERLDAAGMPPMLDYTPARFATFIGEERAFWLPIVRASGARVQ